MSQEAKEREKEALVSHSPLLGHFLIVLRMFYKASFLKFILWGTIFLMYGPLWETASKPDHLFMRHPNIFRSVYPLVNKNLLQTTVFDTFK